MSTFQVNDTVSDGTNSFTVVDVGTVGDNEVVLLSDDNLRFASELTLVDRPVIQLQDIVRYTGSPAVCDSNPKCKVILLSPYQGIQFAIVVTEYDLNRPVAERVLFGVPVDSLEKAV